MRSGGSICLPPRFVLSAISWLSLLLALALIRGFFYGLSGFSLQIPIRSGYRGTA